MYGNKAGELCSCGCGKLVHELGCDEHHRHETPECCTSTCPSCSKVSSIVEIVALDEVNSPPHYDFGTFQVIDVLEVAFPTEPLLWQVGKYILRWDRKGEVLKNLKKAQWYLDRKIKQLESSKP